MLQKASQQLSVPNVDLVGGPLAHAQAIAHALPEHAQAPQSMAAHVQKIVAGVMIVQTTARVQGDRHGDLEQHLLVV